MARQKITNPDTKANSSFQGFVCDINQITPDQVELWLDALGLSARSHNNHLRGLNTFFNFAKVRKYLSKEFDPLEGVLRACLKKRKHTVLKPICASEGISS